MGLTSQRTYQILVCARTRTGCGQGYVVELDTLPNTAPEMPVFIAVSINKTKLNVTWLPSNKGNPGCKFSVSYRQLGKLLWKHTPNIVYEDWVVLTGLRWGAVHEIRVTAKTCGRGKEFQQTASPIRQIQIGEILNYSVPTFKVHQIDGTSFGVSLISASKLVKVFYVQYKEAGSTSWSATDDKKGNEWVIIRNLIKGVMYEVRAVTRSEMGQTAGNIQYHVTGTETEIHSVSEWKGSGTSQARLTVPLFWLIILYIKNAIPWLL